MFHGYKAANKCGSKNGRRGTNVSAITDTTGKEKAQNTRSEIQI